MIIFDRRLDRAAIEAPAEISERSDHYNPDLEASLDVGVRRLTAYSEYRGPVVHLLTTWIATKIGWINRTQIKLVVQHASIVKFR